MLHKSVKSDEGTLKITAVLITRETSWPKDTLVDRFPFNEVIIETGCPGVHRRFDLAWGARNDLIYVQDDDCAIDIPQLLRAHQGAEKVYQDELISYAITPGHKAIYDELCGSRAFLLGWGCFFYRRYANSARWKPFIEKFGPVPSHEADRVFTWFGPTTRNAVVMPIKQLTRPRAMSRDNKQHYASRNAILKQLATIG